MWMKEGNHVTLSLFKKYMFSLNTRFLSGKEKSCLSFVIQTIRNNSCPKHCSRPRNYHKELVQL